MENNKEMLEKGKEGNGAEEKKMTIMLAIPWQQRR